MGEPPSVPLEYMEQEEVAVALHCGFPPRSSPFLLCVCVHALEVLWHAGCTDYSCALFLDSYTSLLYTPTPVSPHTPSRIYWTLSVVDDPIVGLCCVLVMRAGNLRINGM